MRNLRFAPLFFAVAILFTVCISPVTSALDDPDISANAVVLLDMATGQVLFSKNENERVYPASLTKVMTALVAFDAIAAGKVSADDYVTASSNIGFDLIADGSTADIVPGEIMTLRSLLYCALVASANEACNIIAEHVGGSVQNFVVMMNEKAQQLGCTGTQFANTHGLPHTEHFTTTADFTRISRAAADYGLFMEICNTQQVELPATNLKPVPRVLKNTNALLGNNDYYTGYTYEYARGIKTGHTSDAGYCLVSTAINGDYSLMAVVMGAKAVQQTDSVLRIGSFDDSVSLYEWVFANWRYIEVLKSSRIVTDIPVEMGTGADHISVRPAQPIFALLPNDANTDIFEESVTIYAHRDGNVLSAPISVGEVLGEISILLNGEVIGRTNLVATTSIEWSKRYYIRSEIKKALDSTFARVIMATVILMVVLYIASVVRYRSRRNLHLRSVRQARSERDRRARSASFTSTSTDDEDQTSAPDVYTLQGRNNAQTWDDDDEPDLFANSTDDNRNRRQLYNPADDNDDDDDELFDDDYREPFDDDDDDSTH